MLRKRLIFTLIYENGFFSQSRNFRLQKVGDINWLEKNYGFKDIAFSLDELIVLNASRENKDSLNFSRVLNRLTEDVFIPISAGGRVRTLEDAKMLFENGADKVVLNTSIYRDQVLVKSIVKRYGSQSVIASIDYKGEDVFIENGSYKIELNIYEYVNYINDLGVGELYLNSMENDGTGFGFDLKTAKKVANNISMPLIIAGGAGNEKHLIDGLLTEKIDAVATANLFNFMGDGLPNARNHILIGNGNLARWI